LLKLAKQKSIPYEINAMGQPVVRVLALCSLSRLGCGETFCNLCSKLFYLV
jgi:hypothetical protein